MRSWGTPWSHHSRLPGLSSEVSPGKVEPLTCQLAAKCLHHLHHPGTPEAAGVRTVTVLQRRTFLKSHNNWSDAQFTMEVHPGTKFAETFVFEDRCLGRKAWQSASQRPAVENPVEQSSALTHVELP